MEPGGPLTSDNNAQDISFLRNLESYAKKSLHNLVKDTLRVHIDAE